MALKFGWFTEGISTRRPTVWMSMTWRCCNGNGEDGEEARKKNIRCIHVFYANQVIDSCCLKTRASIWCCISEPSQEAVKTACCSRLPQSSALKLESQIDVKSIWSLLISMHMEISYSYQRKSAVYGKEKIIYVGVLICQTLSGFPSSCSWKWQNSL